jgi:putative oxidoreductase
MRDFGVLLVRLVVGGLLAGHGEQKLFGSFGGPGISGGPAGSNRSGCGPAASGPGWPAPASSAAGC